MEELIALFNTIEPLTEENKELMRKHLTVVDIKKGDKFQEVDKLVKRIGYVLEGVLRIVYVDDIERETIRYFLSEGHFSIDNESFTNKQFSCEYHEALTDCKLVVITIESFQIFIKSIPNFKKIANKVFVQNQLDKSLIKSDTYTDDAVTRYSKLITRNPKITQRIPAGHIASYLGVTNSTINRFRNKFQ